MSDINEILKQQVEKQLRERQAGRERQDAGERVTGSRKEMAALRKLMLDPAELRKAEASPGTAAALVRKGQVFPRPDFEAWREAGVMPPYQAAYLFALWKTFPDAPKENSVAGRMTYVRLAHDLHLFISGVAGRNYQAPSIRALAFKVSWEVFGFDQAKLGITRKALDEAPLHDELSRELKNELGPLLTAQQRYNPADGFIAALRMGLRNMSFARGSRESRFQDPDAISYRNLVSYLYGHEAPETALVVDETNPFDLPASARSEDEPAAWYDLIADLGRPVFGRQVYKFLFESYTAHQNERNLAKYGAEKAASLFMPRVVDLYYGSALAGLIFNPNEHLMPTKSGKYAYSYRERPESELMRKIKHQSGTWEAAAVNVGLQKPAGGAEPPVKKSQATDERKPLDFIRRVGGVLVTDLQVHEQFLLTTMGFRAVEYGNYVRDKEGTEHLRHFVGSLVDLCDVLNLNPYKINEAGGLAIAFGSRGQGGRALATYHPSQRIINLTKKRGDGSVAHEWQHYFDHTMLLHLAGPGENPYRPYASAWLASQRDDLNRIEVGGDGKPYFTGKDSTTYKQEAKQEQEGKALGKELAEARRAIKWAGFPAGDSQAIARQLLLRVWQCIRYGYCRDRSGALRLPEGAIMHSIAGWSSAKQRSYYDCYVPVHPRQITFKAKPYGHFSGMVMSQLSLVRQGKMGLAEVLKGLDHIKSGSFARFTLPVGQDVSEPAKLEQAYFFAGIAAELEMPELTVTLYEPVVNKFYTFATNHAKNEYWANPMELFARSFEKFVLDELRTRKQGNNYLVDNIRLDLVMPDYYPQGAEAELINQAWRDFYAHLAGPVGLGPFQADWAAGQRVDEFLVLEGGGDVSEGVIAAADEPTPDVVVLQQPPAAGDRARKLKLAQARIKILALALAAKARSSQLAGTNRTRRKIKNGTKLQIIGAK